jgi:hypothetical protein
MRNKKTEKGIPMRVPFELTTLGTYRAQGRAPDLPVFLSDLGQTFAGNLTDSGALVIPLWGLQAATAWDWSSIAGLEVMLALRDPTSAKACMFARSVKAHSPRALYVFDWAAPLGERISAMMPARVS